MKDLEMAKERFSKISITDVAIEKVPYIQYKGLTDKQCRIIQALAKEVLNISKEDNDSNEVAITLKMVDDDVKEDPDFGVAFGDNHSVEIESDVYSNHLLQSTEDVAIVILHNHPSPQTLSYDDLSTFILYRNIKMILAVTNQGSIHYIMKHPQYDFVLAREMMIKYSKPIEEDESNEKAYEITRNLLKELKQIGLYYKYEVQNMRAVGNKTCLSDSFESQKKAARAVANGLLTNEVRGGRKMEVKKSDVHKAKCRGSAFAKKYGI